LYKRGKIRKLILSGDHGASDYDEVNAMKLFVVRQGVPADDVFMDHAGFRTYDSCYRARDVFGVRSMTIITNGFHLPRALYIANTLGIDAVGVASDRRRYRTENYNNLREFAARCKAYVDINILKLKPKYLGPRIDITASGLVTQD
jgi:SanA protein